MHLHASLFDGRPGIKVIMDEKSLRILGVFDDLMDGKEVELVGMPDQEALSLRPPIVGELNTTILRLRTDGQAEGVFLYAPKSRQIEPASDDVEEITYEVITNRIAAHFQDTEELNAFFQHIYEK